MVPPIRTFGPYAHGLGASQNRSMTLETQRRAQAGDMARRVARRRAELGLTLEEVGGKTGIDPGYLRYFEDHADARLSAGSTLLLAQALGTTPAALNGRVGWAMGRGRAGPHPQLQTPHGRAV